MEGGKSACEVESHMAAANKQNKQTNKQTAFKYQTTGLVEYAMKQCGVVRCGVVGGGSLCAIS